MIPKTLEIGFLTFHIYGLIIGIAIILGWYIAKKRTTLYKIDKNLLDDWILVIPLFAAIAGARIYHVLDNWVDYSQKPLEILNIQNGGLGIWGAIIGTAVGFLYVARIKKYNFLTILDLTAPSLVIGQAVGRIGNYVNQEGFGPPTNLPWKVYIDPENRPEQFLSVNYYHPTFFYESILNLISFFVLIYFSKRLKKPGQIFALYLIYYSTTRFVVEFLRIDTWTAGELKIAQIISIVGVIIGIFILKPNINKRRVDTP